jgi:DNA-3-methyladenine glycosylase
LEQFYLIILCKDFFQRETAEVARALHGHYLCRETSKGLISGMIVETEAYLAENDPACHASRGMTKRNETMFGPPGRAYIYFIYGKYYCLNVVTGVEGKGEAVLIRAVEPLCGIDLMRDQRGAACPVSNLASGPGKLCSAFAVDKSMNGHDLSEKPLLLVRNNDRNRIIKTKKTTRIGLSFNCEKELRFIISGNRYLSRRELCD